MRTRYKDKFHRPIWEGDILHVEEYPGKYVGDSYDFEGIVTIEEGRVMVSYVDIGEQESFPVSMFPINGREVLDEKGRYHYWKSLHLGGEPPEGLWKEGLYRKYLASKGEE